MGWNLLGNNIRGTLTTGINGSVTAMDVTLAAGSKSYPATASADTPLYLTIASPTNPFLNEIVKVTAVSGANVTTMVRGQRGTTGITWAAGSLVFNAIHADDINEMRSTFSAAGTVSAPSVNFGGATTGIYGTSTTVNFTISGTLASYITSSLVRSNVDIATVQTAAQSTVYATSFYDSANPHGRFIGRASRGTEASPSSLLSGDVMAQLQGGSWQAGTTYTAAGYFRFTATENHSSTAAGTKVQLYLCPNTSISAGLALEVGQDKSLTLYGSAILPAASPLIFGAAATEGSWQIIRSGNNLLVQRYESAAWVTKQTIGA